MNELLQKHGCANVFTIPDGLKELMSDISREVLREQPPRIYDFIANYLSVLLITREHGILAVRVLDDLCDCRPSVAEHLTEIGLGGEQSVIIADIIKEEVESIEPTEGKETIKEAQIIKKILTKVILDEVTTAKVCQIARNAYREYWYRKKLLENSLKIAPDEPWEIAAERTLQIYKSTKPSFTELTRAAEKIQAAYRGYHVRRNLLRHLKPKKKRRPKVDLPGAPLDIAASREIDLGPLIDIKVREDNVNVMFDEHATKELGLPYDPQKAITHVEDMSGEDKRSENGELTKSLAPPSQFPMSEVIMEPRRSLAPSLSAETEVSSRRSRVASHIEPTVKQSQLPSEIQSTHLSFSKEPAEIIPDETQEVKEEIVAAAVGGSEVGTGQDSSEIPEDIPDETQEVKEEIVAAAVGGSEVGTGQDSSEIPEDIPDDRTEGDGASAPIGSAPSSARETDATDVEDIAEDATTSGEEEG